MRGFWSRLLGIVACGWGRSKSQYQGRSFDDESSGARSKNTKTTVSPSSVVPVARVHHFVAVIRRPGRVIVVVGIVVVVSSARLLTCTGRPTNEASLCGV